MDEIIFEDTHELMIVMPFSWKKLMLTSQGYNKLYRMVYPLVCLGIVTFLWVCPCKDSSVYLDLKTKTADLTLAKKEKWNWRPFPALTVDRIRIEGVFEIKAPGLRLNKKANSLEVKGEGITLESIGISGSSHLEVEWNNGFTDLYISKGNIDGEFMLKEGELHVHSDGQSESWDISGIVPESFSFSAPARGSQKLHLRLKTGKDFSLDRLQISKMILQREYPPGSGRFVSAIVNGTITLPEVEQKRELKEYDWLRLTEPNSSYLRLTFTAAMKDSFNIVFEGSARSLSAGPEGFEKDLTPSILRWLYHNKDVAILWGALVFVYSLMLGWRSLMKDK